MAADPENHAHQQWIRYPEAVIRAAHGESRLELAQPARRRRGVERRWGRAQESEAQRGLEHATIAR